MSQQASRSFSQPASRGLGGAAGESTGHGWSRFGEPIHGTNGGATAEPALQRPEAFEAMEMESEAASRRS